MFELWNALFFVYFQNKCLLAKKRGSILFKYVGYWGLPATLKLRKSRNCFHCWKKWFYYLSFIYISKINHNFGAPGTGLKLQIFALQDYKTASTGWIFSWLTIFYYFLRDNASLCKQFHPCSIFKRTTKLHWQRYDQIYKSTWSEKISLLKR